jgi:hypothetical protein
MAEKNVNLPVLQLPEFEPNIRRQNQGYDIFDTFRRQWVKLTPEEWVRQSFLNYLTVHLGYPKGRIGVETAVKYDNLSRRADVIVYNDAGKPLVIVECKSADVHITEDVFYQACMYNKQLRARWFFLTNGLHHVAADISGEKVIFTEQIPAYAEL